MVQVYQQSFVVVSDVERRNPFIVKVEGPGTTTVRETLRSYRVYRTVRNTHFFRTLEKRSDSELYQYTISDKNTCKI